MNHLFIVKLGSIALVLLVLLSVGGAVEPVAAQAGNQSATPDPAVGSVGPVTVLDYRLDDGTMTLTIDVERPVAYALSDAMAGMDSQGVTEVPVKQGTLDGGRRTISLSVTVYQGTGGVTLSTPGDAIRIQTEPVGPDRQDVDYQTAQTLVAGSAIFGAGGVYYYFKRRREDEDPRAERIL